MVVIITTIVKNHFKKQSFSFLKICSATWIWSFLLSFRFSSRDCIVKVGWSGIEVLRDWIILWERCWGVLWICFIFIGVYRFLLCGLIFRLFIFLGHILLSLALVERVSLFFRLISLVLALLGLVLLFFSLRFLLLCTKRWVLWSWVTADHWDWLWIYCLFYRFNHLNLQNHTIS